MFRRYFSRVLFGFAALTFVVLWAYAHGTTLSVPPPNNLGVSKNTTTVFFSSSHPYNITCNHSVTADLTWGHRAGDWHSASWNGTASYTEGT
jgi:hypothetical protein